jgi:signal recognition particle receptor subunit beta
MGGSNETTGRTAVRIVYCGPSECGKTTNLESLARALPDRARGSLLKLATETSRTLYFDLLTIDVGGARADVVIEIFSVPGQNFYVSARRRILREADGIVFVVDSRRERLDANIEALHDVVEALVAAGRRIDEVPAVLQLNKCDDPTAMPHEELLEALGFDGEAYVEAVAHLGHGVVETLRLVAARAFARRAVPAPAF